MKTTTSLTAIGLVLAAMALSTTGYAKEIKRNPEAGKKPKSSVDQPQNFQERQKMQMSQRKAAAKRLKAKLHVEMQQQGGGQ